MVSELGPPVLRCQAADAGVGPAVATANRTEGGAHARPAGLPELPQDRVAPQPFPAGEAAAARPPAELPLPGCAHHAAAAAVLHLPVVTHLRRDAALRGVADLRAGRSVPQQACMNRGGEESETSCKMHPGKKSTQQPSARSACVHSLLMKVIQVGQVLVSNGVLYSCKEEQFHAEVDCVYMFSPLRTFL